MRDLTFEELTLPFAVVATDLCSGKEVIIKQGPGGGDSSQHCHSGDFYPIYRQEQVLVDGSLVNRIPVSTVRSMGADIVIAVKINLPTPHRRPVNMADIILQSLDLMQVQLMQYKLQEVDLIIEPEVSGCSPVNFDHVEKCISAGIAATRSLLPQLKTWLNPGLKCSRNLVSLLYLLTGSL